MCLILGNKSATFECETTWGQVVVLVLIRYSLSATCILEHILRLQFDLELGIIDYFPILKSRIRIGSQRPFYRNFNGKCCASGKVKFIRFRPHHPLDSFQNVLLVINKKDFWGIQSFNRAPSSLDIVK